MSARILVVDDLELNVKLLDAKLRSEYYDVLTATSGQEALDIIEEDLPDLVLLDVMMPEMSGFEVCRRIKSDRDSMHLPVVMVTALDQPQDRVQGLEAGADDFLTKPVNDVALFARVRSLLRLKMMTDEVRRRHNTSAELGAVETESSMIDVDVGGARILVVEDSPESVMIFRDGLSDVGEVLIDGDAEAASGRARYENFDLVIVNVRPNNNEGLSFCGQLRSSPDTRDVPLLMVVEEDDQEQLVKGLDIGVNDYIMRPIDPHELVARARTQVQRKRYADQLRLNYQRSLESAVTDSLTGLFNRRYMSNHLANLVSQAQATNKPLSLLLLDLDFFKEVNDTHGHDVGDEVLCQFAERMKLNLRGVDLAARYGGEEFVVVMPDTSLETSLQVAERLRRHVCDEAFEVSTSEGELSVSVSIGTAAMLNESDNAERMLKRADDALYDAKNGGRNRVVAMAG